jgi:hypothetical protein
MRRWLVFLSLWIAVPFTLGKQTTVQTLRPDWDQTGRPWAGDVLAAALAPGGNCAAVATTSFVAVIDKTGRELWRWNFSEGNRYIAATKIAVAPQCDWLAFTGGVGYRYSWIVHRNGKRVPVQSKGTPLAVEINRKGTLVAVGSGAGIVYLYSADGALRWTNNIGGIVPIAELSFADDDSAIMMRSWGQAVISIDGKTRWAGGVWGFGSAHAARDFKTFVAWGEPPHGPGIGQVGLLDGAGKILWERYGTLPEAIISSDGNHVIARTNDNQNPTEEDGFDPRREQLTRALRLIAKDGTVIRTFSSDGEPLAFASDGTRFLIRTQTDFLALDLEGKPLWSIPLPDTYDVVCLTTPDLHTVLVISKSSLAWYSAP